MAQKGSEQVGRMGEKSFEVTRSPVPAVVSCAVQRNRLSEAAHSPSFVNHQKCIVHFQWPPGVLTVQPARMISLHHGSYVTEGHK